MGRPEGSSDIGGSFPGEPHGGRSSSGSGLQLRLQRPYQWLDRAPKGRNETGPCFRRRDKYDTGEKHLRQPLVPECVDRDRYLLMNLPGNERRR
jgi:hypothetical protein